MAKDYAFMWGVEDASFGLSCTHPASPITPDVRARYMAGYNSHEARIAANAALVARERERNAKRQAQWKLTLDGVPPAKPKRAKRHEHGKDW